MKRGLIILFLLLLCAGVNAQSLLGPGLLFRKASSAVIPVNFDKVQSFTEMATGNQIVRLTNAPTDASGLSQLLVVMVAWTALGNTYIDALTNEVAGQAGQVFTFLQGVTNASEGAISVWYLKNPTTTSNNVVISQHSSAFRCSAVGMLFTNCNLTTPFGTVATTTGNGTTFGPNLVATTSVNDLAINFTMSGATTGFAEVGSPTSMYLSSGANWLLSDVYLAGNGGNRSFSSTITSGARQNLLFGVALLSQ